MRILISNDDGISSPGLLALVNGFSSAGHEVFVCAPDAQRSAASHSLTLAQPLVPKRMEIPGAVEAYAVNGTPVDCVKLAIVRLFPHAEMVVSGINHGYNIGTDTLYSGTVGAAMEGALEGLPAIAVSLAYERVDTYDLAAQMAVSMFNLLKKRPLPPNTVLNLNYPACDRALGVKATRLKFVRYVDMYIEREHERIGKYYWLSGGIDESMPLEDDDYSWLKRGYATATVITGDLTQRQATDALAQLL